jgi:hypothetical protein
MSQWASNDSTYQFETRTKSTPDDFSLSIRRAHVISPQIRETLSSISEEVVEVSV